MAEGQVVFSDVRLALPDGRELLRGVTLALAAQTTTALLGRSGSGKTTLLRTVNGLVTPTSGSVSVRGRDTSAYPGVELQRSIGYVIQETGLFPHMTVGRNVAMSFELQGRSAAESRGRAEEVLALTGLPARDFFDRYPWQLSGGQRQRVGLARALMNDPDILLMDEPFGALDPITRTEIQNTLHDLLERVRKTVLMVTHDLEEALYLAGRVIFFEGGEVAADLHAADVRSSSNATVQEYLRSVRHALPPASAPPELHP